MSKSTKITPKPNGRYNFSEPQHYGMEAWRQTSAMTYIAPPHRTDEKRAFFERLWPVTEIYSSVLNPIFLADLPEEAKKNPQGSWLVRDGLLPLIWFFTTNPDPAAFRGTLKIHSDFEEFIPESWRPQVELYRFYSDTNQGYSKHADNEIKELILLGLIMPSVISLSRVESELIKICDLAGGKRGLSKIRVRAFLPVRLEESLGPAGLSYYNLYMQLINRHLGSEIEFLELDALKWLYPAPGTYVHEFNEKWLYADSYLSMIAMSKPARFLNIDGAPEPRENFETVYPIYPHVSCYVRKSFKRPFINYLSGKWTDETQERAQLYYRAMNSSANNAYPWPNWFETWCKNLITDKT